MKKPIILSVSYGFHDSSLSLSSGRHILASVELERFFRIKKMTATPDQMQAMASFVLARFGLTIADVDLVVSTPPPNKYWGAQPSQADVEETEAVFLGRRLRCLEVRHHYAHAGLYLLSDFGMALITTCDSGGNTEYAEMFRGEGSRITRMTQQDDTLINTVGYNRFSILLYGAAFSEGKMMGLSAYGAPDEALLARVSADYEAVCKLRGAEATDYIAARYPDFAGTGRTDPLKAAHLAKAVQVAFVDLRLRDTARFLTPQDRNLVVLGGAALNLEVNAAFATQFGLEVFVPPNADDTGISLGQLAIAIARETGERPRAALPYLGLPETAQGHQDAAQKLKPNLAQDPEDIAARLARNDVCLAHIGRAEVGPRALGHRSFLMSALDPANKTLVSEQIKAREPYRPVAPLVREEDAGTYFTNAPTRSPYMLFSHDVRPEMRALLAAITHVDGTARAQTVSQAQEPFLHAVLTAFKARTGHGVLINTSLNLSGEPLVDSLWQTRAIFNKLDMPRFVAIDPAQAPIGEGPLESDA